MGRIQGDLLERTFRFSLRILSLSDQLPNNSKGWAIARQLVRSGTSIGANVREADHAISSADFAHKCSVARKEAAETNYWLELCREAELMLGPDVDGAIGEADELTRILVSVVKATQLSRKAS